MKINQERLRQRRKEIVQAALRAKHIPVEVQSKEAALFIASVFWSTREKKASK